MAGNTPIAIDYTYCPRPLGLAKLLLDNGFNVRRVYLDTVSGKEFTGIIRGLSDIGHLIVEDTEKGELKEFAFKEIGYIL